MRTIRSTRNAASAAAAYMVGIVANMAIRFVFVRTLPVEYLGITGLFASVLSYLSLAELGLGNAVVYALYRPLAHSDHRAVAQLIRFFRKAYVVIALVVTGVGLLIMPLLHTLGVDARILPNLYILYVLYLFGSVSTYFVAHHRSLLLASQEQYMLSFIDVGFYVILGISQYLALVTAKSFAAHIVAQVAATLVRNLAIVLVCTSRHPMRVADAGPLPAQTRGRISKDLRALFLYRISGVVVNATPNVVISALFGLGLVGSYSNYHMVIHAAHTLLAQCLSALTASVGNLNVDGSIDRKRRVYNAVVFGGTWAYGTLSLAIYLLIDPIIVLWVGQDYVLDHTLLRVLVLNFFLLGMVSCFNLFRNAFGLFVQGQARPVVGSIINVSMSILCGRLIGLPGVFLGTTLGLAFTNLWYDPYVVHRHVLQQSVTRFYARFLGYVLVILAAFVVAEWAIVVIAPTTVLLRIVVGSLLSLGVSSGLYVAFFQRTREFGELVTVVERIVSSVRRQSAGVQPA